MPENVSAGTIAIALMMTVMAGPASAATVSLYAAGSLRGALTDVGAAYQAVSGNTVQLTFGPSGTLKDQIASGAKADVFASANLQHPQALHDAGKSGPVVLFARNKMCALATPLLRVASDNLLERMLDGEVKLAISTPLADPSGDYALEVFRKADKIKPGALATLEKKAKQLTGSAAPPAGRNVYGWHVAERHTDIFLTYCTNAMAAKRDYPDQQIIALSDDLAVGADYGLVVTKGATAAAEAFADFIVSPDGEAILARYGFSPGTSQ